ncbi:MAG: hypothetical protein WCI63_01355 [bacterium]
MKFHISYVRNIDFASLIENFLFTSVATILGIRIFLALTGYPQLGGGNGLHIAHMLWGGLLMLIAIVFFLAYLNKSSLVWGSILGGIGFGFFIDELGKFLTSDNNYFFKPTFALMYGIFLAIYLASKIIEKRVAMSHKDYMANALDMLKQAYISDFNKKDKEDLLHILEKTDKNDPFYSLIKDYVNTYKPAEAKDNIIERVRILFFTKYTNILKKPKVQAILISIFVFESILGLITSFVVLGMGNKDFVYNIIFIVISGLLVLFGLYFFIKKNRLKAFEFFKYSLLVTIFFSDFILFYQNQLSAIIAFFVDLALYLIIRYLIEQEITLNKAHSKT